MARLAGLEPTASGSGDQRSIQLSYRRTASSLLASHSITLTGSISTPSNLGKVWEN